MASNRCSASHTSSSAVEEEEADGRSGGAADRMVKIELEAAEVLADLAHFAAGEQDSAGNWGRKGKRGMKRVKGESSAATDGRFNSAPKCWSNRSEDQHVDFRRNKPAKLTKSEQKALGQRPCSTSHSSFGGGRSRQNLTEAEREAQKIRRILANRESARQTIRRRQALCEELARKAADLSEENENLKKEKEFALKEYQCLETMNKELKARVAKSTKVEIDVVEETQGETKGGIHLVEETQGESKVEIEVVEETEGMAKSCQANIPTSQPNSCPVPFYDRPSFTPLFWPAMVKSSNPSPSQHGPQNPPFLSSNVSVPIINKPEFSKNPENLVSINGPITPIYLLPCPWFFPLPDHGHGLHHQSFFCADSKQEGDSVSNQSSACITWKYVANIELNSPALSIKAKSADSGLVEAKPVNDLNEIRVEYSQNGGGSVKRAYSLAHASCSSVQPPTKEYHVESQLTGDVEASSSTAMSEQNQEQELHPSKKPMEAFAAAEARRRRKELTKLKSLNGRRCRMYS